MGAEVLNVGKDLLFFILIRNEQLKTYFIKELNSSVRLMLEFEFEQGTKALSNYSILITSVQYKLLFCLISAFF